MKMRNIFAIAGILFLASCGGNRQGSSVEQQAVEEKPETTAEQPQASKKKTQPAKDQILGLKPYSTKVEGYLSGVLEVADGIYSLSYVAKYPSPTTIQVKVKSIGRGNPEDEGLQDGKNGPLVLTLCNAAGEPLANFPKFKSSSQTDGFVKDIMDKEGEAWVLFDDFAHHGALSEDCATFIISSEKAEAEAEGKDKDKE